MTCKSSFGGTASLLTYPLTQTHADVPEAFHEKNGITDCLLRMSVGIENVEDLILDLRNAFRKAGIRSGEGNVFENKS